MRLLPIALSEKSQLNAQQYQYKDEKNIWSPTR
jgi:hypothetical protein